MGKKNQTTNKPKFKNKTNPNKPKKTKNHVKTWTVPQKFSESQEPATHQAVQTLPCFWVFLLEVWGIHASQVGKRSLQVPQTKVLLLNHWIKTQVLSQGEFEVLLCLWNAEQWRPWGNVYLLSVCHVFETSCQCNPSSVSCADRAPALHRAWWHCAAVTGRSFT